MPEGPTISAYPDGPLIVRGDFTLVDAEGEPIPRSRRTVALCRCGGSTIKPFCDGTHKVTGFRTEDVEPEAGAPEVSGCVVGLPVESWQT